MGLKNLILPITVLGSILVMGGFGFHLLEDVDLFTSFYWTISTVTTVGYGDIVPKTVMGRSFATVLMVVGIGTIFYTLTSIGKSMVEGGVWKMLRGAEKEKDVKKMENHVIICGYGEIGQTIAGDLLRAKEKAVIVDNNEDVLRKEASSLPYIVGEATNEEVLEKAGVRRAKGLFVTLPNDSDNIVVTLSAKDLNPKIRVVSRAKDNEGIKHLRKAGAESVVLPETEGGLRMSRSFVHPELTLLDYLWKGSATTAAVHVHKGSRIDGVKIKDSAIKESLGLLIIAMKRSKKIITNPEPKEKLRSGDTLIAIGAAAQIENFKKLAGEAY